MHRDNLSGTKYPINNFAAADDDAPYNSHTDNMFVIDRMLKF